MFQLSGFDYKVLGRIGMLCYYQAFMTGLWGVHYTKPMIGNPAERNVRKYSSP